MRPKTEHTMYSLATPVGTWSTTTILDRFSVRGAFPNGSRTGLATRKRYLNHVLGHLGGVLCPTENSQLPRSSAIDSTFDVKFVFDLHGI